MIELELSTQECLICREVLSCVIEMFKKSTGFKNQEKWNRVFLLVDSQKVCGFEAEELRMIISAFNVHYLLMAGETEKLSRYLKSNMHESEDFEGFFERVRETFSDNNFDKESFETLKKRFTNALKDFTAARRFLPRKLYISDLHFYHMNLNHQMDMRGFEDDIKMNEYMIGQWQDHVNDKDEVYLLGDFSVGRGKMTNDILRQLPGKKFLLIGNHDHYLDDKEFDPSLFQWVKHYAEIKDRHRTVILSHYPIFCYNGQYKVNPDKTPKNYMLYGHVHDSFDERLVNEFIIKTRNSKRKSKYADKPENIPCNMINCFCMYSDYVPLTLDEWIELDEKRRKEITDV